jgi:polo-like kinase 1
MQKKLSSYEGSGSVGADAKRAPQVWIARWLDYTEKYGMAYLLSNGCVGVFFNDTSKIVLASNGEDFEYIERSPSTKHTKQNDYAPVLPVHHTMSNYPDSLKKKVTLLRHFKGFLFEEQRKRGAMDSDEEAAITRGSGSSDLTFVKKWIRTPDAILFRLSNRTVQVNFKDTSSIVLCSESSLVTYADKSGNRSNHVLSKILHEGRPDISRRLRYTRDILHQLSVGKRKENV